MSHASGLATPTATGQLERDVDGSLHGWCWYPDQPMMRATVDLLRDQEMIRGVRAVRLVNELRERGMGDGYFGFWFPDPLEYPIEGKRVVLEARERRLGTTIGRVVLGSGAPALKGRLDACERAFTRAAAALDRLPPELDAAAIVGDLGRTLLHMAATPGTTRGLAPSGLRACLQQVSELPAADLGWAAAPALSVIVTASGGAAELAARIRGAARALCGQAVEFLLVDDGSVPMAALLPTRLRNLVLVRVPMNVGRGAGLNAAAAAARGVVLAYSRPGGPGLAGLDCTALAAGAITLEAAPVAASDRATPPWGHGLQCVVRRSDLAAMGGFDPWADEAGLWADLRAKAAALGLAVTTMPVPHRSFLTGASR